MSGSPSVPDGAAQNDALSSRHTKHLTSLVKVDAAIVRDAVARFIPLPFSALRCVSLGLCGQKDLTAPPLSHRAILYSSGEHNFQELTGPPTSTVCTLRPNSYWQPCFRLVFLRNGMLAGLCIWSLSLCQRHASQEKDLCADLCPLYRLHRSTSRICTALR
nr:hypothetical protein CFP56_13446 [Quercus suber]